MKNRLLTVISSVFLSIGATAAAAVHADPVLPIQVYFGTAPAGSFVPPANVQNLVVADGNQYYITTDSIDVSKAKNPAPAAVYQVEHFGQDITYTFSGFTAGKEYTVRLHFAEVYVTASGQRVFDVLINKQAVLKQFDIVADAGGKDIADVKQFDAKADSSGNIVIELTSKNTGGMDNAEIHAIEILAPAAQ